MSRGIDISHHNTCTDYTAAKAAVDWVYIKVTEGAGYIDPARGTHHSGFAGKPRGPYHFMRGYSAAEVANFVAQVRSRTWELPPMLDAEYAGVTGGAIRAFLNEYQRQTGEELTVVYTSKSLLEGACNPATFATPRTVIWAARYYANSPTFSTLGWDHPQLGIYQYWDKGYVPGFAGGIDLDIARTDFAAAGKAAPSTNGFSDMSDAYPTPKVLADGSYRYHVSLSNWDKVNGRYVALSTGFSGCEFEVWVQLASGGYVSSPDQIPSGSYGKVLKGSLAPDNVHWLGIPAGAQSVSVQVRPSTADGVPGVTVFTDGK